MSEHKVVMNLHALLLEVHYAQNVSLFDNVWRHKNKFPEDFAIKKISNFTENLWVILNNVHKLFRDVQS